MTHSLHRYGNCHDLTDDYIVFAMPARGLNDARAVETQRAFLRRALAHNPVNIGDGRKGGWYRADKRLSPAVHWRRDTAPDPEAVINGIDGPGLVSAVFDNYGAAKAFVAELREADLGVSVNLSARADDGARCCEECGITRHSVEFSLGFRGAVGKLPEEDTLALATMCGHGMISHGLAAKMIDRVRAGRMSPEDASKVLARFCVCSIFNPSRATRILRGRPAGPASPRDGPPLR